MSMMSKKMSAAASGEPAELGGARTVPNQGDHFRCVLCGMELEITRSCKCSDAGQVHFQCCGQEMKEGRA
jgi:hypothetical protein